ncbi:hypothetical protein N326_07667, partial [Eurypyga helias]
MKTPREKYQPVDDFVGLQSLMAEPKQKRSDLEVDYVGVKELFDTPEEIKETSVNNMASKEEDTAPPCPNSSHKYGGENITAVLENKGNILQGEESQQKESAIEDQFTQRPTRGRPRKTAHPVSAKQCEKDLNLKELQSLGKKSTQEEMGVSVPKNKGRGRRTKHPGQEEVETVSSVESCGATRRTGRGKRKAPEDLNHPNENLGSCGKDSPVLRNEPANMKQTL